MVEVRFRRECRIIGYIQWILLGLVTFFVLIFSIILTIAVGGSAQLSAIHNGGQVLTHDDNAVRGAAIAIIWVFAAIALGLVFLEAYAAWKLIRSTDLNRDPKEAHRMAVFWRNVTIVILVLTVIGYSYNAATVNGGLFAIPVLEIIVKGIFLYFGIQYIKGLAAVSDAGYRSTA